MNSKRKHLQPDWRCWWLGACDVIVFQKTSKFRTVMSLMTWNSTKLIVRVGAIVHVLTVIVRAVVAWLVVWTEATNMMWSGLRIRRGPIIELTCLALGEVGRDNKGCHNIYDFFKYLSNLSSFSTSFGKDIEFCRTFKAVVSGLVRELRGILHRWGFEQVLIH